MKPSKNEADWGWKGRPNYGYGHEEYDRTKEVSPRQWVYLVQMLVALRLIQAEMGDWWRGKHYDIWLKLFVEEHMLSYGPSDAQIQKECGLGDSEVTYIVRASERAANNLFMAGRRHEIEWVPMYCGMAPGGGSVHDLANCGVCEAAKMEPGPLCMGCYRTAESRMNILENVNCFTDEMLVPRYVAQTAILAREEARMAAEEANYEAQRKAWLSIVRSIPTAQWETTVHCIVLVVGQTLALREGLTCGLRKVKVPQGQRIKASISVLMKVLIADANGTVRTVNIPEVSIWAGGREGMKITDEAGWYKLGNKDTCSMSSRAARDCLSAVPFKIDDGLTSNADHWSENPGIGWAQSWGEKVVASRCRLHAAIRGHQDRMRVQLMLTLEENAKIDERWDEGKVDGHEAGAVCKIDERWEDSEKQTDTSDGAMTQLADTQLLAQKVVESRCRLHAVMRGRRIRRGIQLARALARRGIQDQQLRREQHEYTMKQQTADCEKPEYK